MQVRLIQISKGCDKSRNAQNRDPRSQKVSTKKVITTKEIQKDIIQILAEDSPFLCKCEEVDSEIQAGQGQHR